MTRLAVLAALLATAIAAALLSRARRRRWPMPEDFDRMTPAEFEAFVRDTGILAEAEAARAEDRHSRPFVEPYPEYLETGIG